MSSLRIEDGAAWIWFAYDVGLQIDLDGAQKKFVVTAEREVIRHQRRAPAYLQFQPAPVRLVEAASSVTVGAFCTDGRVEATLYDFGAVSIGFRIPIRGHDVEELHALAIALDANAQLLEASRNYVLALITRLGDTLRLPCLADLVEEYTVFHVRDWTPRCDPEEVMNQQRALVARVLRAEAEAMREGEVQDALQFRIAYGLRDDLVVDWNGAFLFDALGDDTLAVLEFANVELLEMRFLDGRLDEALDSSHLVLRPRGGRSRSWRLSRREVRENMRRIGQLQIDNAILYESVNNAIKLLGDQFLARVYRLAARRFHLDEWDTSILRKLETLDSIYGKLSDEQATRRMELLEWIVILLIVLEIVMPFAGLKGH